MRERAVILTRLSQQRVLERRYGTAGQLRFALQASRKGLEDLDRAVHEESAQTKAVRVIRDALPSELRTVEIDRDMVAQFLFEPGDLVIAVGQDGLVANVGKYLDGQPLAGVNPDPQVIDGTLLPFSVETCVAALPAMLTDRRPIREVTLAEATTSDRQILRGLNEIFVGVPSHQSARYRLSHDGADELQSSSGLIIATGTGSSGWLRSLEGDDALFDPAEDALEFAVREAWPGRGYAATLLRGRVTRERPLEVESRMEAGILFADGIEADPVRFDAGVVVTIRATRTFGHVMSYEREA
jgi:NAD kinase